MRERVEGLGGRFSVAEVGLPAGVSLFGELPRTTDRAREAAE
jgi:two-component system sensor histidine kinase UhpB